MSDPVLVLAVAIVGLAIGSFLNVVIHRLPRMMEAEWKAQCAELAGAPADRPPDSYTGLGLLVDGGRQITVKNAVIRGFKVGILARKSSDLRLTHNDLSYNWKQRLYSGVEKESLVDWMSYHQNDKDEWLRYGAGIYLSECDRARIDHNSVVQGQNGLIWLGDAEPIETGNVPVRQHRDHTLQCLRPRRVDRPDVRVWMRGAQSP